MFDQQIQFKKFGNKKDEVIKLGIENGFTLDEFVILASMGSGKTIGDRAFRKEGIEVVYNGNEEVTGIYVGNPTKYNHIISELGKWENDMEFGPYILFSGLRIEGFYNYRNMIMIYPVPENYPQHPKGYYGYDNNPFLIWIRFNSTQSGYINGIRRDAKLKGITLILDLLIAGGVTLGKGHSRWSYISTEENEQTCVYNTPSYWRPEKDDPDWEDFKSKTSPILLEKDFQKYYSRGVNLGDCEIFPENLEILLDKYFGLDKSSKKIYDNALFRFNNSNLQQSESIKIVFLVSAIEALIDNQKIIDQCDTCTQSIYDESLTNKFVNFVDKYSGTTFSQSELKKLYNLRSKIVHGDFLSKLDKLGVYPRHTFSISKLQRLVELLLPLTKTILINWLISQPIND